MGFTIEETASFLLDCFRNGVKQESGNQQVYQSIKL
jgi:hypothetical protein